MQRAALQVHTTLGPGLLESVYPACLCYELRERGLAIESQVRMPASYDSVERRNSHRRGRKGAEVAGGACLRSGWALGSETA